MMCMCGVADGLDCRLSEFFRAGGGGGAFSGPAEQVPTDRRIGEGQGPRAGARAYVKHLEDKLWEMRMVGRDGIARAIYVTASGQRIVVLHAFVKKTEKTPRRALETARARAKEVV